MYIPQHSDKYAFAIGHRSIALPALTNSGPIGGITKRVLDLVVLLLALPFLLPLMLGVCLLMKCTDRGPLFYGHRRIGYNGKAFQCWKFRSMVTNGDEMLEAYLAAHPEQSAIWEAERKLDNDPRVTRVGAVLRKLSLDELPQVVNVLNGEMSLVGPRPVIEQELENYASSAPHYMRVRPGVTGLWQVVSGRSDTTYRDRVRLDRYYVSRWTLMMDLWILFRTIPAVLASRGAK